MKLVQKQLYSIFKSFVKNAVKKENARPFKVAKNVEMMVIDSVSGKKADFGSAETIIESFKKNTIEKIFLALMIYLKLKK